MKNTFYLDEDMLENRAYNLSAEEKSFYIKNGYLIVEKLFSVEECTEILDIVYTYAEKEFPVIMNLDRREPIIFNIMKTKRLVSVLNELQNAPVSGLMSQVIFKQPGSAYAEQAWDPHQDNSYVESPNGLFLNALIPLKNQSPENGSLYIYPGSHTNGIYKCKKKKSYREGTKNNPGNKVLDKIVHRYERVDVSMNQGDVIFIHGNCIHGSYGNKSKTLPRPMLQFGYITKGEPFLSGKNAQRKEIPLC